MSNFKLGKLDPKPLAGVGYIDEYQTVALPNTPPSVGFPPIVLRMDGNGPDPLVTIEGPDFQGVGDCTVVGARNLDKGWNYEVHEGNVIPSPNEVVKEYFELTGGQDTGLVETDLLQHWVNTGLFSYKIDAFAPVQHNSIKAIEQAVAFYGGCYFGVQLPQSAQDQFNVGGESTWSVVPGSPIEGGHCIACLGFNHSEALVQIATWGQVVNVTYAWLAAYLDEAYAIIPRQFVEAKRGPVVTLDLASLIADLKAA